jgi:2-phosphoglycerate kinase
VPRPRAVFIRSKEHGLPFSKGLMSQSLTAAGLTPERAYALASMLETRLLREAAGELTVAELHEIAIDLLRTEEGDAAALRFRRWAILKRKDIPIIMLVGGTTGSGKSTVASQVAHRLGITRVTSTDLIRQVMRAFFSPALMPVLHHSSFDVPVTGGMMPDAEHDMGLLGFIEQSRQVCVGVQAILERAERERMSTLIEGVHLVPGLVQSVDMARCAVVELMVYIQDEETHRLHFTMRGLQTDGSRPVDHYLRNFDRIRDIQEYLVTQAERRGVPVIENTFMDETVRRLTDYTLDIVERVAADIDAAREAAARAAGTGSTSATGGVTPAAPTVHLRPTVGQ